MAGAGQPELALLELRFKPMRAPDRLSRSAEWPDSAPAPDLERDELEQRGRSSILLVANKFAILMDDMQRIELRYSRRQTDQDADDDDDAHGRQPPADSTTRVIGSRDAQLDRWNTLVVTDDSNDLVARESFGEDKIILITPEKIELADEMRNHIGPMTTNSSLGQLFLGGLPKSMRATSDNENRLASLLGDPSTTDGFVGCIDWLRINGRQFSLKSDLDGDVLDGFDVGESPFLPLNAPIYDLNIPDVTYG